ncbi:MAG: cobalt ECF transporter T component CbiQ [Omnitrophica bacterium RBG_13_46_9]|nr:MAG: cobalt ECF transporter T component CbiQ [Omnitrophica bacterium RBG_13_46_9]
MHHPYIDKYAELDSPIHRIDPRVKIICAILIILGIIFTEPTSAVSFICYGIFLSILVILSRIPVSFILARSSVVIPFVIMIAIFIPFVKEGKVAGAYSFGTLKLTVTYNGLVILLNVLVKSYLSVLCMTVFTASLKFSVLLKAFERLKFPNLLIMIFSFMYRYIFVVIDELMHVKQAKDSRTVGGGRLSHTKTLANVLGVLFVRSYERAESVYIAMRSRGFNGTINTLYDFRLRVADIAFVVIVLGFVAIARFSSAI